MARLRLTWLTPFPNLAKQPKKLIAQAENSKAEHLVPVPLIGFGDLVRHLHHHERESRWHQETLDKLTGV